MNRVNTLRLHLGVHKTATTHFQSRLFNSQHKLAEAGIAYLDLDKTREYFTSILSGGKELSQEAKEFLSWKKVVLLSDENILGGTDKPRGKSAYKNALGRLKQFSKLVCADEIEPYLTIRNPEDYLISRYCEYLRHYPYLSINEYFDEMYVREFSWLPLIKDIKEAIGKEPVVTIFEDIFKDENRYLQMLSGAEIEFEPPSVNPGLKRSKISDEAYSIVSEMALHYPMNVVRRFMDMTGRNPQITKPTPIKPFSVGLSDKLKSNYRRDKKALGLLDY
ncbi:hypothetical protein [Salinicola sp. CR57]|uniref:hypothetical protein n=1 Tax=Salinicola sp. CR57 TaxID=1949086 RepID=UPI0013009FAD|nr:hypothetical protein [Salinicola sp. CR57]